MSITKISLCKICLMCGKQLKPPKVFVCHGTCEDLSGVNEINYPEYLPQEQLHQLIARKIIARRKFLEDNHIMI